MTHRDLAARSTRALVKLTLLQGAVLFASAGTLAYGQAWLFLSVHTLSSAVTNLYLLRHCPELLESRLALEERGETEPVHKLFFALLRVLGLVLLVLCGLDRRFGWSRVPGWSVLAASLLFCTGAALMFWAFHANRFASSVIEVSERQTVISTGPYRWVRHPMYSGALLGIAATPIILGSYCATLVLPLVCAIFVMRILAEERLLARELPGYADFLAQRRARLIPKLW